jgi:DNA polymerase-3 subunit gamma/tau
VQWLRVIGDLDINGQTRQLAANCVLIEHSGNIVRLAIDPAKAKVGDRSPAQVEKLTQALTQYVGSRVKVEFVEAALATESLVAQNDRRSAEALDAARRVLEDDPTVRDMKTRFGATLHPESVRPTEEL